MKNTIKISAIIAAVLFTATVSFSANTEFISKGEEGVYSSWNDDWKLPEAGKGVILFKALAEQDIHIAISDAAETKDPMYEIVIGGWSNTKSAIRRVSQGAELASSTKTVKETDAPQEYWVSIDSARKTVSAGYGSAVGKDKILEWKDPAFLAKVQFVSFSSWANDVAYTDIRFTTLTGK
jgi:hypothetical protein